MNNIYSATHFTKLSTCFMQKNSLKMFNSVHAVHVFWLTLQHNLRSNHYFKSV